MSTIRNNLVQYFAVIFAAQYNYISDSLIRVILVADSLKSHSPILIVNKQVFSSENLLKRYMKMRYLKRTDPKSSIHQLTQF